jgi:hypothetical protein
MLLADLIAILSNTAVTGSTGGVATLPGSTLVEHQTCPAIFRAPLRTAVAVVDVEGSRSLRFP